MKALSILQPWAWLILRPDVTDPVARDALRAGGLIKPVENRRWATRFRGPLLIHAGKKWGREQREDLAFVRARFPEIELPEVFDLGGLVGSATVVDCVSDMDSPWFFGPFGFVLANQTALPRMIPYKGALGFFEVPDSMLQVA
ncbi:MAG: hypothetical protein EPN36_03325 [Rhodanobacteraceae bacterium]|nr:MAG: hypothetical protein EPN36_03325 [Rhodanobacteraceae bacterium]